MLTVVRVRLGHLGLEIASVLRMTRLRSMFALVLAGLMLCGGGCAKDEGERAPAAPAPVATAPARPGNAVVSPAGGYSLVLPPGWGPAEPEAPDGAERRFQDKFAKTDTPESLNVQVIDAPGATLSDMAAVVEKGLSSQTAQYKLVSRSEDKLGGVPARRVTYDGVQAGRPFRMIAVACVNRDRLYTLLLLSSPERHEAFLPVVRGILDSFQWPGTAGDDKPTKAAPPGS